MMVYEGKKIYLKDWVLPRLSESQKMGFTDEQYQWVVENETYIWQYFVEKQLIFSTEQTLRQFYRTGSFSKFCWKLTMSPQVGSVFGWDGRSSNPLWNATLIQTSVPCSTCLHKPFFQKPIINREDNDQKNKSNKN